MSNRSEVEILSDDLLREREEKPEICGCDESKALRAELAKWCGAGDPGACCEDAIRRVSALTGAPEEAKTAVLQQLRILHYVIARFSARGLLGEDGLLQSVDRVLGREG